MTTIGKKGSRGPKIRVKTRDRGSKRTSYPTSETFADEGVVTDAFLESWKGFPFRFLIIYSLLGTKIASTFPLRDCASLLDAWEESGALPGCFPLSKQAKKMQNNKCHTNSGRTHMRVHSFSPLALMAMPFFPSDHLWAPFSLDYIPFRYNCHFSSFINSKIRQGS